MSGAQQSRRGRQKRPTPASRRRTLENGLSRIDPNPPPLHLSPWNSCTIVLTGSGSQEMYVKNVATKFVSQLDPNGHCFRVAGNGDSGCRVQLKFQRLRLYAPDAKTIGLSVEDFLDVFDANKGGRDQLAGVADVGTSANPPALQFVYPPSHRSAVIRTDDIWWSVPLFNVTATSSTTWLAFVYVKWMPDGPIKFTTNIPTGLDVLNTIATSSGNLERRPQPSLIDTLYDGAKVAASVIAMATGDQVIEGTGVSEIDSEIEKINQLVRGLKLKIESRSKSSSIADFEEVP